MKTALDKFKADIFDTIEWCAENSLSIGQGLNVSLAQAQRAGRDLAGDAGRLAPVAWLAVRKKMPVKRSGSYLDDYYKTWTLLAGDIAPAIAAYYNTTKVNAESFIYNSCYITTHSSHNSNEALEWCAFGRMLLASQFKENQYTADIDDGDDDVGEDDDVDEDDDYYEENGDYDDGGIG